MITEYLSYLQDQYDYKKEHGHDRVKINSVLWYFHNYEHGYKHCKGGKKNPYEIGHHGRTHTISKQYARGHGTKRKLQWFKFNKQVKPGWWDLESGVKVSLDQVPSTFK